ncbi:MAG TPA: hypothetical protein VMX16_18770 [Terriglobia bacterium]|nr:hypothetical protein [Terriglobia bacterium]
MLRIVFDTSAINKLEDGGNSSEPLIKGLKCGFEVILTGMSAGEIISTKDVQKRGSLLSQLAQLLDAASCIWPPHVIIELLISAHISNPSHFDWTKVDVRARAYEEALPRRDFDEELCAQERKEQFKVQKRFKNMWAELRPRLDRILVKDPSRRPTNYSEAVAIATADGGVLWGLGRPLYKHVSGREPTEADIKAFVNVCPPFRAMCYGLVMAWYKGSLRNQDRIPVAGRNDLMMAAYLPYCDRFVTEDWPQREELREIAAEAKIDCRIVSLEDFDRSFAIVA